MPDARRTVLGAGLGDEAGPLGDDPAHAVLRALRRIGPACRVGLAGPVPARIRDAVGEWASAVVGLDEHRTRLRMVKSDEEPRWLERRDLRVRDDVPRQATESVVSVLAITSWWATFIVRFLVGGPRCRSRRSRRR